MQVAVKLDRRTYFLECLPHLDVHRRALAAWRSISHQTQLVWNALAEDVEPHRPPFDHKANISGQNLFVSAYHGFYTLGNEHLPVPRAFDNFPPYSIDLRDAHVESGAGHPQATPVH